MSDVIPVQLFRGQTQLPLFNKEPGWLQNCGNMRVKTGGYLEMRGGIKRLKPSGGTAANPTSVAGAGYLGAIDGGAPFGWFRHISSTGFEVAGFNGNLALRSYVYASNGVAGEYMLFGADRPFSSVTITILGVGANPNTYSFGSADGAPPTYSALTTTSTFDFTTAVPATGEGRQTTLSWAIPTTWVPTTEGNATDGFVCKYWIKVARTAPGGAWLLGHENTHSDWHGSKEVYVAHGAPNASASNGIVSRYSNNVGTSSWFQIGSNMFSGNFCKYRFASYRGVMYFVNGRESKRWDGSTLYDMGLPRPTQTFTVADGGAGPGTWTGLGATLQFRYAFTYGYGSQQVAVQRTPIGGLPGHQTRTFTPTLLGQSPPCDQSVVAYPAAADRITIADANQVSISIAVQPPANVDAIYVYRTEDLTNVPTSAVSSMPYYLTMVILRDSASTGQFSVAPTTSTEQAIEFPFPKLELDQEDTTPPPRGKVCWIHKNRLFIANSDRFPARVWWSRPFEPDRYYTDEDFEDFSTTQGGQVVAGTEFMNQSVVFTEDQTYGIADVDVDQFQSYPLVPGIGCVAPDAVAVDNGVMIWPGRYGVYMMDQKGEVSKISVEMDPTFQQMSIESHGWSRAIIHNNQYEIFLQAIGGAPPTEGFRFDLITGTWSSVGYGVAPLLSPLAVVTAPVGTEDQGQLHPLLGPLPKNASNNWNLYIGELGTSDDGNAIGINIGVHFGPSGNVMFKPDRILWYYQAANGWDTPTTFAQIPDLVEIGYNYSVSELATSTAPEGSGTNAYSVIQGKFLNRGSGTQDIILTFSANSVDGQTLWGQRLLGAFLEGQYTGVRRK